MTRIVSALILAMGLVLPSAHSASAGPETSATADISIPVLCYHVVSTNPRGRYQLDLAKFRDQMAYLASNGYTTLSADEYYSVMTLRSAPPPRPVLLTFDDGTADFAENVVPVLRQHAFTAVQFTVTGWVDSSGYLTSAQLQTLATDGYDIQNHTRTHEDLSSLTYSAAYDQVSSADTFITSVTGKRPEFLAYPYGRYDSTAQAVLRDLDVKMGFTVSGGRTTPGDDFLALNRYLIGGNETMSSFIKKVS